MNVAPRQRPERAKAAPSDLSPQVDTAFALSGRIYPRPAPRALPWAECLLALRAVTYIQLPMVQAVIYMQLPMVQGVIHRLRPMAQAVFAQLVEYLFSS